MKQSNNKKSRDVTAFLYERLSRDDNLEGESYSIGNQKKLLAKVAKEKGYTNLVHFLDDGISGVTMDRPGFVEMIRQLEQGKAAAVFVKDLSRLGRNYIEVGRLTEEFFPDHDIRLVAVSDNIDTAEGENELAPIRNLFNEWYRDMGIPADINSQRQLLRGLMNIRAPQSVSADFLQTQDAYLQGETAAKGITDIADLTPIQPGLHLWQGDITTLKCDAIVNAANSGMTGCYIPNHRCIDNAIHTFAGVELRLACAERMEQQGYPEPTGQAKITPAFNLPCRYVLHTVGPIISGRVTKEDKELLASCYRSCLELAAENDLESVAFCCISTGEFHFPNEQAAEIAVRTVKEFLKKQTSVKKVIFNVFKDLDKAIYEKLL